MVRFHKLDIIDKHKLLIPTGDYTTLNSEIIRPFVPDLPFFGISNFGANSRDIGWPIEASNRANRRKRGYPSIETQNLPVPVEIVIRESSEAPMLPLLPTLHNLVSVVARAIEKLALL